MQLHNPLNIKQEDHPQVTILSAAKFLSVSEDDRHPARLNLLYWEASLNKWLPANPLSYPLCLKLVYGLPTHTGRVIHNPAGIKLSTVSLPTQFRRNTRLLFVDEVQGQFIAGAWWLTESHHGQDVLYMSGKPIPGAFASPNYTILAPEYYKFNTWKTEHHHTI